MFVKFFEWKFTTYTFLKMHSIFKNIISVKSYSKSKWCKILIGHPVLVFFYRPASDVIWRKHQLHIFVNNTCLNMLLNSMYCHWYFIIKATWSDLLTIIAFSIYLSYKSIILERYGLLPINANKIAIFSMLKTFKVNKNVYYRQTKQTNQMHHENV